MATNPQAQSSVPSISLATLRQLLAESELAHPERGQRHLRAATIVALRRIERGLSGMGYWVQSESDPEKEYWVVPCDQGVWVCNCQDFQQRGGPCKHALAVQLLHECERREAAGPNLVPFPLERYGDAARFELTPMGEAYLSAQEPGPVA